MFTLDDIRFMKEALELARFAYEKGEVPVGAVLVQAGEIIGRGFNQPISTSDPTNHAEIVAIREAAKDVGNYRLPGSTLYTTLEPCLMCAGALVHARVHRLVYGAAEPRAGVIESNLEVYQKPFFNHQIIVQNGLLQETCSHLLKAFFKEKRDECRVD